MMLWYETDQSGSDVTQMQFFEDAIKISTSIKAR